MFESYPQLNLTKVIGIGLSYGFHMKSSVLFLISGSSPGLLHLFI